MPMEKTFDAAAAEPRIYAAWEQARAFAAGANARRPETFSVMIPPPNVTGSLHMGHAFNNTLQDILTRWHRMRGFDTLWQPGTDHAGIATQMVTEREMAANGEPDRRTMGRDRFLDRVWQQKVKSRGTIIGQLKRLGASCDWDREAFTMSGAPGDPEVAAGDVGEGVDGALGGREHLALREWWHRRVLLLRHDDPGASTTRQRLDEDVVRDDVQFLLFIT